MSVISRRNRFEPAHRRAIAWLLAGVAVVVLLVLCVPIGLRTLGGDSSSSSAPEGFAGSSREGASLSDGRAAASAPDTAAAAGGGVAGAPAPRVAPLVTAKIARSAWLGVQVADLTAASAQARAIASAAGGQVTSENVVTAPDPLADSSSSRPTRPSEGVAGSIPPVGVDQARLTLSVPADRLDGALAELARLGTVSYRSSQAVDVTDSYVDTQARIDPAKASVSRIQALLASATDLKQVVLIESELSKRQADLDSLTQRMAQLEKQTTMSDVTVTFWTGATAPSEPDSGFAASLQRAWNGLLTSVSVIVAGFATLLPWLVVLALIAWIVVRIVRRRGAGASAESAAAAAPAEPTKPTAGTTTTS